MKLSGDREGNEIGESVTDLWVIDDLHDLSCSSPEHDSRTWKLLVLKICAGKSEKKRGEICNIELFIVCGIEAD